MPSRLIVPGATLYVRATALEVHSDAVKVLFDDGVLLAITHWVPARECAMYEQIGELMPIRRRGSYLER